MRTNTGTDWTAIVGSGVLAAIVIAVRFAVAAFNKNKVKQPADSLKGPPVFAVHPVVPPPTRARKSSVKPGDASPPIELVRDLMGPRPREFAAELKEYLHSEPPAWLKKSPQDPMNRIFAVQEAVRREGKIVWASIVQANSNLFDLGPLDHGGEVVWSPDPYFDTRPNELAEIGHELFSIKGTDQTDPETAMFSRMLANEMTRGLRMAVPKRFTGGREVYQSSVMLTRRHLPTGYLARNLFPVWARPVADEAVLLVPAAYWPPSLTTWWKEPGLPGAAK